MSIQKTSTLLALFLLPILMLSQAKKSKSPLDTISIKSQFEYVYSKSNNYNRYKVVSRDWYSKLEKNTLDSLKGAHEDITKNLAIINQQKQTINSLKTELNTAQNDYSLIKAEKDNMPFLGVEMSKSSYTGTMWAIILALLGGFAFFVYRFKNSNSLTKEAQKLLSETENEFEEHRRNALEREQKVRRQLQDELNKQKVRT